MTYALIVLRLVSFFDWMASDIIIRTSKRPLDPTLLNLEEDEATFFKLLTGIQDEEELKKHIIHVQGKAYQARFNQTSTSSCFPVLKILVVGLWIPMYPSFCIYEEWYLTLISETGLIYHINPAYKQVLELPKSRPGAILLDIGCCCV